MKREEFLQIAHLEGIEFVQALLHAEEQRSKPEYFMKDSTFEDINADFGLFPTVPNYPVYFAGDIREPANKLVFIGINPGYNAKQYPDEMRYLQERGLFEGYCRLYADYFKRHSKGVNYYSNVKGFLRRLFMIQADINWDWYQQNLVTLELIPYHSVNIQGLRINDCRKFREVYFEIILKLLKTIDPQLPVFINGFPSIRDFLTENGETCSDFRDVFQFKTHETIAVGKTRRPIRFHRATLPVAPARW